MHRTAIGVDESNADDLDVAAHCGPNLGFESGAQRLEHVRPPERSRTGAVGFDAHLERTALRCGVVRAVRLRGMRRHLNDGRDQPREAE